ncbi:MAG: AMP-binding protein [Enterobacterales bacterium]|nr:AMP-binding protein [Enterobacterales bacterium]
MSKAWHQHYPVGCNTEISEQLPTSMAAMFRSAVDKYSDQDAYQSFGQSLTYSDIDRLSEQFAAYLQQKTGVKKGDRVAVMCPNSFGFAISMWGIIRAGGVQVSVNPLYLPHELENQLNDAQVETIIIFSASTQVLAEVVENTPIKNIIVVNLDDLIGKGLPNTPVDPRITQFTEFTEALEAGKKLHFKAPDLCLDDLIFLQYTGGTTGLSKGAMLSHGNLVSNIHQYREIAGDRIDYGKEVVITAIPMYHIFALCANTLCYFSFGSVNVLITNPRDMPSFVETWKHTNATFFTGVNTLFNGLVHTPGFDQIDFSSLKLSIGGGAPVQQAVSDKWKAITGKGIKEGYGLSETSPVLSLNLTADADYVNGIGIPIPSTDISIRDEEGHAVAQGESGELCAKGPQIMQGYWQNEAATAESMTEDGYFKTGDIAMLDDQGFFHIVDRKKDMILVSGFNVFPTEIEAEVAKMEGVLESACIGVEDEKSGGSPQTLVVKKDPDLSVEQVIAFCKTKMTAYKVPRHVVFIDEIPKSTVGKLLRRELRNY